MRGDFQDEDGEGLEGIGVEEGGGEGRFGGGEEVGEALEYGHLVDQLVDVGDIENGGEPDSGEHGVSDGGFG